MSSDAITLLGGTSPKISSEEASAGFVIPPSARPCVHNARRESYLPPLFLERVQAPPLACNRRLVENI